MSHDVLKSETPMAAHKTSSAPRPYDHSGFPSPATSACGSAVLREQMGSAGDVILHYWDTELARPGKRLHRQPTKSCTVASRSW